MVMSAWDRPWCASLGRDRIGEQVEVVGWVRRRRDLGGLVFVDLRDRSGLLQLVFEEAMVSEGERLSGEDVIGCGARCAARAEGQANTELASGEIELLVEELEVLNTSETPPFVIEDRTNASEELRLTHRYLDLRRPEMTANLVLRHQVVAEIRRYFDEHGLHRGGDPDPHPLDARGGARFSGAVADPQGVVLRPAAVAAALQTAAAGGGSGSLRSDRPLLPRRGSPRRPAARVHPGRRRGVVHRRRTSTP